MTGSDTRRRVFVIHGRNEPARLALFTFLRAIGLDPIEWSEAIRMSGKGSPYIGEVLTTAFAAAQAVVVLQTPDDVAYLHESLTYVGDPECEPQMQPRPNVLFEAGMAMGRDEDRTIIVELGQVKVFSDIHGRHVVRLSNDPKPRNALATRLETAGCAVKLVGDDWLTAGDFTPPAAPGAGLPLGRKMPSSRATGLPRLTARYIDNGGSRIGELEVHNHGPGDVYDLDLPGSDAEGVDRRDVLPVKRLPEGKSIRISCHRPRYMGSKPAAYFDLKIVGRTVDGSTIDIDEFVSTGA